MRVPLSCHLQRVSPVFHRRVCVYACACCVCVYLLTFRDIDGIRLVLRALSSDSLVVVISIISVVFVAPMIV